MPSAEVRLFWTKSVSTDVASQELVLTSNGNLVTIPLGPTIQEYTINAEEGANISFHVDTIDTANLKTVSATYSFSLSDLTPPEAATGLGHEIVSITP